MPGFRRNFSMPDNPYTYGFRPEHQFYSMVPMAEGGPVSGDMAGDMDFGSDRLDDNSQNMSDFDDDQLFYAEGFSDGGAVSDELGYEAQRFLDLLREAELEAAGGGVFTPIPAGRVAGYGANARATVPVGRGRGALDLALGHQGVSASGHGFRSNQNRLSGAGVGYTFPRGDRLSLDYHDRLMGDPDTLPGSDPLELMSRPAPSRGLRLGYRREF